jgi:polar amino acid transport system substrate-binding protein
MRDVQLCEPPLAMREMFIYLHKKHKALVPKLANVLREMKQDGRYQILVDKHLTPLK